MRTTTNWHIPVPSSNADPDAVPTHLGDAVDFIDGLIANCDFGTFGARPPAGHENTYYMVSSGTNVGILYWDNGTAWVKIPPTPGLVSDVTTAGFGDAPSIGVKTDFAPSDHRHGMPANPVTAHVSASNPHPQYALSAAIGPYAEALVSFGNMGASKALDLSQGNAFKGTLNSNCVISITNTPSTANVRISITFEVLQNGTGGWVVTWPSSFDWGTAGPPVLSGAGKADFISAYTDNNGTQWKAASGAQGGF